MRIYSAKDYRTMSRKAANIISAQVIMKPDCILGLATGSTPIGTYDQLIDPRGSMGVHAAGSEKNTCYDTGRCFFRKKRLYFYKVA